MCDSFCDWLENWCDRMSVYGGLALSIVTQLLIFFGAYCANKLSIFYWFYVENFDEQLIKGLPLSFYGLIHFAVFNFFVSMSIITHVRAYFADPGRVPDDIEVPEHIDTNRLSSCEKCDMRWKPERAHHCSECGTCIFKVSCF